MGVFSVGWLNFNFLLSRYYGHLATQPAKTVEQHLEMCEPLASQDISRLQVVCIVKNSFKFDGSSIYVYIKEVNLKVLKVSSLIVTDSWLVILELVAFWIFVASDKLEKVTR